MSRTIIIELINKKDDLFLLRETLERYFNSSVSKYYDSDA